MTCKKPVDGSTCCLERGHDGPCDREATEAELQAAREAIERNRPKTSARKG